jgi:multiple sugar transport system permease protein
VLLVTLFAAPVAYSFYLAFTNLQLAGARAVDYDFTGLDNVWQLVRDPNYWHSTKLTIVFLVASGIVGQTVLGMALALLMRRAAWGFGSLTGAVVVVAWVIPDVTAGMAWYALAQPGGTIGGFLGDDTTNYLSAAPLLMVCLANAWHGAAFSMLMFSAALRGLPQEVLEAADVDGASATRRLFSILLPMMKPAIITNLLLVTLLNLSAFTVIQVLTQGGPGDATTILPLYMYIVSFSIGNLGYGAMVGLALLLLGTLFASVFALSYLRNRERSSVHEKRAVA